MSICTIQMATRWYVVYIGHVPGVYEHWEDVQAQVNGFPGNCYKGYKTRMEAEAHWRRRKGRNGMRTGYMVIPLFVVLMAVVLYLTLV